MAEITFDFGVGFDVSEAPADEFNISIDLGELLGTTQGMVAYYNGTTWTGLAVGTSGQFLMTQGAAANPTWADAPDALHAQVFG